MFLFPLLENLGIVFPSISHFLPKYDAVFRICCSVNSSTMIIQYNHKEHKRQAQGGDQMDVIPRVQTCKVIELMDYHPDCAKRLGLINLSILYIRRKESIRCEQRHLDKDWSSKKIRIEQNRKRKEGKIMKYIITIIAVIPVFYFVTMLLTAWF